MQNDFLHITNEDNMDLMARYPDNHFDLAIVDPPYGINMAMGHKGSKKRGDKDKYKSFAGNDNSIPNEDYFAEIVRVSKNQIVWGANYMIEHLEATPCFIVWDKMQPEAFTMSMCEIGWTSFKSPAKIFKKRVVGADDVRIHPTQKPVKLYEWILKNYAKQGDKILDTHLGSMSIAIAVNNCNERDGMQLHLTGCELDKEYFENGVKRIRNSISQTTIFSECAQY